MSFQLTHGTSELLHKSWNMPRHIEEGLPDHPFQWCPILAAYQNHLGSDKTKIEA